MDTKKCRACSKTKPIGEFRTRAISKTNRKLRTETCCISCSREYMKQYYENNREDWVKRATPYCSKKYRESRETSAEYSMYHRAKSRAKRRDMEFTLSKEDVVIPDRCPVLDIPLKIGDDSHSAGSPSLDRIDNDKGYTTDNVCVISYRANSIKRDASINDIRKLLAWMEKHHDETN